MSIQFSSYNGTLATPLSVMRLCNKSVHGSTSSPRTDHGTLKINYLAVRPEPFGTVHPELVEGMNDAQDRHVEG
jgi:hypothetical protein